MARLLVVDDDARVRETLGEILTREGHTVEPAANGREALALLERDAYDLIVSDLRMPELDGAGLYEAVKARWPDMCHRMLFITGTAMLSEHAQFIVKERPALLTKPVDIANLCRTVRMSLVGSSSTTKPTSCPRR